MKKVLIAGKNSFVGMSIENWLGKQTNIYKRDTIDMKDDLWTNKDFSKYDVVLHVAGIAHIKETTYNKNLYYRVNRDLAYENAKKAKSEGVKHFIYISSMSVYGINKGIISKDTPLRPKTHYGKSKLQAEELLQSLENDSFKVAIIRPPLIYGKGCKGNYPRLANLATKMSFFPYVNNVRSMIYIDNFTEFIRLLIDESSRGLFFPQNSEYVNISELVQLIANVRNKKIRMTSLFNPVLRLLDFNIVNKVFADLVYEKGISKYHKNYNLYGLRESIILTEVRE